MWLWRPLDPKVLKMGYELMDQSFRGGVFSRKVWEPSLGQGRQAMQASWEAVWLVPLASWRKGPWQGRMWPQWAAEWPGPQQEVPGGATGLQMLSHLRGRELWHLPALLLQQSRGRFCPPDRQQAGSGHLSPRGCSRRRRGGAGQTGHSPAGQSCYEEQDGTDVQFIPEVTEVQECHLRQPELVGVIEELREDMVRGLAVATIVT